jgi:hypothetical protein
MKTFIIAEVAKAHDGSLGILHSYVDALASTGVDVINLGTISKAQIVGGPCLGYGMPRDRCIDINDAIGVDLSEFLTVRCHPNL